MMSVKNMPIGETGLTVRAVNALRRKGIHTVGDMLEQTEESLYKIRNLGQKTVTLILAKIDEYKALLEKEETGKTAAGKDVDFDQWIGEEANRQTVLDYLREENSRLDDLELLSARAYNVLMLAGQERLTELAFQTQDQYMKIPMMDPASAAEIEKQILRYIHDLRDGILAYAEKHLPGEKTAALPDILMAVKLPEYRDQILEYTRTNDRELEQTSLSNRSRNQLAKAGYRRMSDIVLLSKNDLLKIPAIGPLSVADTLSLIEDYLKQNESRILAYIGGDRNALWDDEAVARSILRLYGGSPFGGFSLDDFEEALRLPELFSRERLKKIIGGLLAEHKLEYVDYRCYRVYDCFLDYYPKCQALDERSADVVGKRLQGITLAEIGTEFDLTRERVRQIAGKAVKKIRSVHVDETDTFLFDEDYYRYLFETYALDKKEATEWLCIPSYVWNYLEMTGSAKGSRDLEDALTDREGLETGMRLKIKNYLNRNKLFVDGMWIEKRRAELEEVAVRKLCGDDVSFATFVELYNGFLHREGIEYDESLYITDAVFSTRKNRLSEADFLLWKQNEQLRYYDINGRDYAEMLDELDLDAFENVELSTDLFMREHPELMKRYDIRDRYELHNLLRKIVPEGSFHNFSCGRMPTIRFGTPDRDKAIWEILEENAPISQKDLADLVSERYGYDPSVVAGTYLKPFAGYYHDGTYTIDFKKMPQERMALLKAELTEEFYYTEEIRKICLERVPGAEEDEINPYNLKALGFQVYSKYVLRNHDSAEEYFQELLLKEDIYDLLPYKKRYSRVQSFYDNLLKLKRDLQIVEFEPNKVVTFRKLERGGVTKEMLRQFCEQINEATEDETYFSILSVRRSGFDSELFKLGFSDWFYSNLLISDPRFSYGQMFGNLIFYKGKADISAKSFLIDLIRRYGSVDVHELMDELADTYGCSFPAASVMPDKVRGSEVYYDKILERLYANKNLFYTELEEGDY